MKKKINLSKSSVFGVSFLLLAFTLPAISWSPAVQMASPDVAVTAAPASPESAPSVPVKEMESPEEIFEDYVGDIFDEMDLRGKGMKLEVFRRALTGYQNLKQQKLISPDKSIISIVDFSKASRYKRLWILDLQAKKVLFHSYVAHGRGSGDDKPYAFSNKHNSHQSSLGFYITAGTYSGKHGLSLKLNGLDAGFNTNAFDRAIVVHGADYVSKDFIKQHGRLGRSHGCPAIPQDLTQPIINTIKDKTVMYIDAGIDSYSSVYLNKDMAATHFAGQSRDLENNI
jgi:L,D-transpeptidase catalytic domain